jgi:hypothetical protein
MKKGRGKVVLPVSLMSSAFYFLIPSRLIKSE